jgi:2-keto-3-deoxygluconate permease
MGVKFMQILKGIQKVPGGLMVAPLICGAAVNTFFPGFFALGGFTTALFKNGALALVALFVLCMGAQLNVKQVGIPLYKGAVLTGVKFVIGVALGWGVGKIFGPAGFIGLTPLAIIAAVTNSNGALFCTLGSEYGDATDIGAISILSLNDGPFFTMIALGATGLATVPFTALIAVIIPIFIGFLLGNLDEDFRKFLSQGNMLIPFLAFALGAGLDFKLILKAGLPGFILGIACVVLTGLGGYYAYALFGGKKAIGAGIGTTAGNAVATPAALALVDPKLANIAGPATAQIAAAVIVTAIFCPMFVSYLDKRQKKKLAIKSAGQVQKA